MIAFTHPWALLLALPAAWLLWRSRRRTVPSHAVANLFLWLDAAAAPAERLRARRRIPPWLVWIQASVITLLAVAIAGSSTAARPKAFLIVDASPSMSARDGAASRIDLARAAARGRRAAEPSLTEVDVTGGRADLVAAIATARRQSAAEIAVISDLPAPPAAEAHGVSWQQVGTPADNVAITALDATADGGAIVEVQNFGARPQRIALEVSGGPTPWSRRVDLPPDGQRAFLLPPAADRTLTARLHADDPSGDAVAADDARQIDVRRRSSLRVQLVAGEAPLIEAALRALPDIDLTTASNSTSPNRTDIVVCAAACAVPDGVPSLSFIPGGPVERVERSESNGARRITVAVDFAKSTWALTPAFPIFVAEAIEWLSRRTPETLTAARLDAIAEADTRNGIAPDLGDLPSSPASAETHPVWIVLSVIAFLGLAIDVAVRFGAPWVRAIAAALVIAGFAGVPIPRSQSDRSTIIALDVSASVAGNQRAATDRIRRETDSASANDHVSVVRFGGADTDIADGLRQARAALPSSGEGRLALISDGQQTSGDAVPAAGAAGVPIDVVPIDSRTPAFIARVDAPVTVHAGAAVPIRAYLKGAPAQALRLTIAREGAELDSRRIVLDDRGEAAVVFTDVASGSGVTFYRALLSDDRLGLTLSEGGAAVTIAGRGKVLVISDRGAFASRISHAPFDVITVSPAAAPDSREALASFNAIVIDGVAPHRLTSRQLDAIASAISADGAGLWFLGSADSLDASEFPPGPFSDALPIDFTALPTPSPDASSLALVVDISGSMATTSEGVTKISVAREAIARALALVPKADSVEVIGFSAQPVVLIGPDDAHDARAVEDKLKSITPSGSTAVAPAVRQAADWLRGTRNQRRRILLVTDGRTSAADADATRAAVRDRSIEVSVVTIGSDAERGWLTELASTTGGRSFFPDRLADLPREVAREAARGAKGREINERFTVRGGAHPLSPGDDPPVLGGYVAGRVRDGAVAAWKSPAGDAVLAAWPRGLGRVAAFSSDIAGAWGAPLQAWRHNATFWPRALDWIARSSDLADIDAELTFSTDGPRAVVEMTGAPASGELPTVTGTIAGPSGQSATVALHPVTATRFEAPVALGDAGDYRATFTIVDPGGARERRTSRGWYWTGDRESQARGVNLPLLQEIARVSGGRVLPPVGAPVAAADMIIAAPRTGRGHDGTPWWLLAALALLSFDYIRRISEVTS